MPPRLTIELTTEFVMISRRSGWPASSAAYGSRICGGKYSARVRSKYGSSGIELARMSFLSASLA